MARTARVLGWLAGIAFALVLLAGGGAWILVQTQTGHDFLLRTVIQQLPRYVNGEVEVAGLRSDGLLRGFVLHGVAIRDTEGRPFVEADSVRVRYSARALLRREIVLAPADVWSPKVTLEATHADPRMNATRIFAQDSPDVESEPTEEEGRGVSLILREASVHDGELVIRRPIEGDGDGERLRIEGGPNEGGLYQVLRFSDVNARIAAGDLVDDEVDGERFRLESLSFTGHVLKSPFRVEGLRGDVRRRGGWVTVRADELRLPGSTLAGTMRVDWTDEVQLEGEVSASALDLADFQWFDSRIPAGSGSMDVQIAGPLERARIRASRVDLATGESRVRGALGLDLGEEIRVVDAALELAPFHLHELAPWLDDPLPVQGRIRGDVAADGLLSDLQLRGTATFDDPGRGIPPTTATVDGRLHVRQDVAATDLAFLLDPLDYATLRAFVPELDARGTGSAEGHVSGSLGGTLELSARLEHRFGTHPDSRFDVEGTVRFGAEDVLLGLAGDLAPLSLDGVGAAIGRPLPVEGEVSGAVRADGPLSDLSLAGRLETASGVLDGSVRFDVRDPMAHYQVQGSLEELRLHALVGGVPEPTVLSGDLVVDGRGMEPESLSGTGALRLQRSTVAGVELDVLSARFRAEGGRLFVDDLEASAPAGRVSGGGDLALRAEEPEGEVFVVWEVDSFGDLGAALTGEAAVPVEAVSPFDPDFFRFDGVTQEDPGVEGAPLSGFGRGELRLRGGYTDLRIEGFAELEEAAWDVYSVDRGTVDFVGRWAPDGDWEVDGALDLGRFTAQRFEFLQGSGEVAYRPGAGAFRLDLRRNVEGTETYRIAGAFTHEAEALDLALNEFSADLDDVEWRLEAPTRILVEGRSVQVADLRIARPGEGTGDRAVHIGLDGLLDLGGDSDLSVSMVGVDLDRFQRIIQLEGLPTGALDLAVEIRGPATAPQMTGELTVHDFGFDGPQLSLVEGTVRYADRLLTVQLDGELRDRTPLTVDARFPVDLAFEEVPDRFPDREVDVTMRVSGLPLASALGFLEVLEDLDGTLEGELRLRGTPDQLEPSGVLRLRGGGVRVPDIGLRAAGIAADLRVREDRSVEVLAEGRARGPVHIVGTVSLEELTDPRFDLEVVANGFQAVERRDLAARVGGTVRLAGTYREPRVSGRVRVEQGELFLEEVARTAEVIDLADPRFYDVVDTTLVAVRPTIEAAQNPFLRNLVVDVELALQRDFWLRSREMNAEIAGDLTVNFERPTGEMVLVGTLEPVRGSYTAFGRQFQVQSGSVEFPGTPGINPQLGIQAVHRLRRERGEPLNIIANVEGTLVSPSVRLTTDAQPPIAESDLISYLLFGRPSYALASGEQSVLEGAERAAVTMGIGTVATQLGSVVARQFGVDYFAITQAQDPEGLSAAADRSQFAHTQIEVGQYIGNNLFLAVILRPLTGLGATAQSQVPGARLEWRFADTWSVEGFVEDRFAREGASRFGDAGVSLSQVFGLSVFREWGF